MSVEATYDNDLEQVVMESAALSDPPVPGRSGCADEPAQHDPRRVEGLVTPKRDRPPNPFLLKRLLASVPLWSSHVPPR